MKQTRKYHKTVKCFINVDIKIAPIIQYIFDKYKYSIIPFSSCENNNDKSFISVIVRDMKDFNIFIEETNISAFAEIQYLYCNEFIIRWDRKHTKIIIDIINQLKNKNHKTS